MFNDEKSDGKSRVTLNAPYKFPSPFFNLASFVSLSQFSTFFRFVFGVSVAFFDIVLSRFFDMSFSSLQILAPIFFAAGTSSIFHFSVERFSLTLALFSGLPLLFATSFFDPSVRPFIRSHSPIFTLSQSRKYNSLCPSHLFKSRMYKK